MTVAERWQVEWPLIAVGVALAIALVPAPASPPPPAVVQATPPVARHVSHADACPAFARARLHVADDAVVTCLRGTFGEPGYFLHAFYKTTEWWERATIVSDDGTRALVPPIDEPSLRIARDGDEVQLGVLATDDPAEARDPRRTDRIWILSRTAGRPSLHILTPLLGDDAGFRHRDLPVDTATVDGLELVAGELVEAR